MSVKPMTDDDYKLIMQHLGMPESMSLLQALKQVANHTAQALTADVARLTAELDRKSRECERLREALELCEFALEPYDDVKPRDWKSDRENLMRAHKVAKAARDLMKAPAATKEQEHE